MTYAVIDLQAKTMTYARAGHTPLLYVPARGNGDARAQVLVPDGLVLGLKLDEGEMFDRLLEEQTIPLCAGDLYLFLHRRHQRGDERGRRLLRRDAARAILEEHADLPSEELRERVLREVAAFVGDAPQHDDMTMILLKVDPLHA